MALTHLTPLTFLSCVSASPTKVYERAVANLPPAMEKRFWQRYIYLWVRYALYEELDAEDADRAREVYRACLKLIPHQQFTFAKVEARRGEGRARSKGSWAWNGNCTT